MLTDRKEWQVLSRLLDEALDVAPNQREQWLESLPPEAAAYAGELRSLLRHAGTAQTHDFLNVLPELRVIAHAYAAGRGTKVAPGSVVGPYVVEQEIGSGGMGTVWLARRSDGIIKRPVALKLPHSGLLGSCLAERFERERNILAELAHPNIARLYDAGFSAEGQPYLALEYVAGAPITVYCDQQRLDIRQRLQLFQQVLRAVQYAHSSLVIHRDLKPSNVIVGQDGRAMLLDFGIAKLIPPENVDSGPRTQLGMPTLALTPEYASPEQVAGQPITTASDIYALGVLLFELLTGECPYRLERNTRAALEEAILNGTPHRPSQSEVTESTAHLRASTVGGLLGSLRGDLDTIVLKALRKSPHDRYPTADALSQDIHRYLAGEPIAARTESWYHIGKFILRHRVAFAGAGMAFLALIATAAVALYEARAAAIHARAAAAERDRALIISDRNAAVGEFLHILITEAARSNQPVAADDLVSRSEVIVNKEYQDVPENRAAVLDVLSGYYDTREEYARSEQLLREAMALVKSSADSDLRRTLTASYAEALAKIGHTTEAVSMLNSVLRDPLITDEQAARALIKLSRIAQIGGDGQHALPYAQQALQRLRKSNSHPPPALEADFLADIGLSESFSGHSNEALPFFGQSLARMQRAGLDHGLDSLALRNNWAVAERGAGSPKVALELINETLRLASEDEPDVPPKPTFLFNRAVSLEDLGRYRESQEVYLRCTEEDRRTGVPASGVHCLAGLASVSLALGDLTAAKTYLAAGAAAIGPSPSAETTGYVRLRVARASLALREGRLQESRADVDGAITDGKEPVWMTRALLVRAEISMDEDNFSAAEADVRRGLELAETARGNAPYSNRSGLCWLMLGRVLQKEGKQALALEAFRTAVDNLENTVDSDHPQLVLARQLSR
jgi:eukaryotic-like serine/threonine-protein kinase